jgi:glycolate oxidase FAD binding subunit
MDTSQRIVDAVVAARDGQRSLNIAGSGSKRSWLPRASAEMLSITEHTGIVEYDPAELVVTVRAGTPIQELMTELARAGQALAFEPPKFYDSGTVGGMVSSGLSGPARPWAGSVRDAVLGVELVNGLGEHLRFGGQVMKNVAGYDVSRLATGAYGALGVILQVSLRVQPVYEKVVTLHMDLDAPRAIEKCRSLARLALPVTGSWWCNDGLFLRLAGSALLVDQTVGELGAKQVDMDRLWRDIRDHNHPFFRPTSASGSDRGKKKLWRIVVPPAASVDALSSQADGEDLTENLAIEWAGGLRWLWHEDSAFVVAYAKAHKGWAWALGEPLEIDEVQKKYMQAIREAFDPHALFDSPLSFGGSRED